MSNVRPDPVFSVFSDPVFSTYDAASELSDITFYKLDIYYNLTVY